MADGVWIHDRPYAMTVDEHRPYGAILPRAIPSRLAKPCSNPVTLPTEVTQADFWQCPGNP